MQPATIHRGKALNKTSILDVVNKEDFAVKQQHKGAKVALPRR